MIVSVLVTSQECDKLKRVGFRELFNFVLSSFFWVLLLPFSIFAWFLHLIHEKFDGDDIK